VPDIPEIPVAVTVERRRLRDIQGATPSVFVTPGLSPEFGAPNIPDDGAPGRDDSGSSRSRDTGTRDTRNPREGKRGSRRGGRNPEVKRAPPPVRDLLDKKLPQVLPQPPPNLRPPSPIDLTLPYTEEIVSTGTRLGQVGRGLLGLAGAGLNFLGLFLTPSPLGDSDLGLSTRAPPDSGDSPVGETPEVIVEAPRLPAPAPTPMPPPAPFDFLRFGPGDLPNAGNRYPLPDSAPEPIETPVAVPVPGTPYLPLPATPTLPNLPLPVPVPVPVPVQLPLPATPPLPQVPTPVNLPTPQAPAPTPTPQLPPQFLTTPLSPTPLPMPGGLTPVGPPRVPSPVALKARDPGGGGGRGGCKPCKPCKKSKKKKKKKKERKERTICYRGTYTETTKSTLKQRKEQIPCQSSSKKSASPQTRPLTTSSAVPRLNSRAVRSSLPSVSRSPRLASSPRLPAVPTLLWRNPPRR